MEVAVLGPVEVTAEEGSSHPVAAPQEQALVIALAIAAPDGVASGRLIDTLWGDEPPPSAAVMLKSLVHRLRRRHGSELIGTVTGGYRLGLPPDRTDIGRCLELRS